MERVSSDGGHLSKIEGFKRGDLFSNKRLQTGEPLSQIKVFKQGSFISNKGTQTGTTFLITDSRACSFKIEILF